MDDCDTQEVRVNTNTMPRCKCESLLNLHLRLILWEMDQRDLQPQTEYPGPDCRLPSDLNPTARLDSKPGPHLQALNQVTLSRLDAADAGQFGRQAQSVSLLDRLLFVMRLTASNKETKLAELAELDSKVRISSRWLWVSWSGGNH